MTDKSTRVKIGSRQGNQNDAEMSAQIELVLKDTAVFFWWKGSA